MAFLFNDFLLLLNYSLEDVKCCLKPSVSVFDAISDVGALAFSLPYLEILYQTYHTPLSQLGNDVESKKNPNKSLLQ